MFVHFESMYLGGDNVGRCCLCVHGPGRGLCVCVYCEEVGRGGVEGGGPLCLVACTLTVTIKHR